MPIQRFVVAAATIGCRVGILVDDLTMQVRAAILRDIMAATSFCPHGTTCVVHLPREVSRKLSASISALTDASGTPIQTSLFDAANASKEEVDCWFRYTVAKKLPVSHRHVFDRDHGVDEPEDHSGILNDDEKFLVELPYHPVRPAPPSANPLLKPKPNPYARPWFQFAMVDGKTKVREMGSTKGG